MTEKIGASAETFPAFGTKIGNIIRVAPGMRDTISLQAFPVRNLHSVQALMPEEVGSAAEALLAFGTTMRFFTPVGFLMGIQVGIPGKCFPTFQIGIKTLSGVDALVAEEVGAVAEAFPAFGA